MLADRSQSKRLHGIFPVQARGAGFVPAAALGDGFHLGGRRAGQEAEGGEHLGVFLVERAQRGDGFFTRVGEVEEDAQHQVFAELEVLAGTGGGMLLEDYVRLRRTDTEIAVIVSGGARPPLDMSPLPE